MPMLSLIIRALFIAYNIMLSIDTITQKWRFTNKSMIT